MRRQSSLAWRTLLASLLVGLALPAWGAERPAEREARARAEAIRGARSEAWLGVFLRDALDGGVEVYALVPDGPAQRAGLREGDLILEIGGEPTPNQEALGRVIARSDPGEVLQIGLLRGAEGLTLPVEVGRRGWRSLPLEPPVVVPPVPAEAPASMTPPDRLQSGWPVHFFGLQLAEMTPALREHFGAPPDVGVLVLGAEAAETAAAAGFRVGDVLVQLGGREIRDEDQVTWTLASWTPERPLVARVIRGGKPVVVELATSAEPAAPASPRHDPDRERVLLERRIQAEIERLEQRLRDLREELAQLQQER